MFEQDLRAAEHMAGRKQRDAHIVAVDRFAIGRRLALGGEVLAVAGSHDSKRLRRGENRLVAGAGMVGMAVGNDRPVDGPDGVDESTRRRAIKALRPYLQPVPRMYQHHDLE